MTKSKSILISFSGYPLTPSSFLPDNGLANLAGALIREGHKTKIFDYGTVSTIEQLRISSDLLKRSQKLNEQLLIESNEGYISDNLKKELLIHERNIQFEQLQNLDLFTDKIIEDIGKENPDFIGLKLWNGDGLEGSFQIADKVKKFLPGIKVFAGGPHADWFMNPIMESNSSIDALCYGEGEETIVSLANSINQKINLSSIPNLILRDGTKTPIKRIKNLDDLAYPIYDPEIYPAMLGDSEKIKIFMLDESRGCVNTCNFCIQPIKSGNEYRNMSALKIIEQIKKIQSDFSTRSFRYAGSNTHPEIATNLAKEIIKQGLDIDYGFFGELLNFQKEDFELIYESGCKTIFFGLESASSKILNEILNKNSKVSEKERILNQCKESGIFTIASVIYPNPCEDSKSTNETLDFLLRTRPDGIPVTPPGVLPRTKWGTNSSDYNLELNSDFVNKIMTYKVKLFLPPLLWDELPYSVNGKNSKQIFSEMSNFVYELEKNDLLSMMSDDLYLISRYSGMNPREFRDNTREALLSGNHSLVRDYVKTINKNLRG